MTELTIGVRTGTACVVLMPAGELDLASVPVLHRAIVDALATEPAAVTVDLCQVTFCDSTGISALIRGRRQADAHGVAYRVINPRGQVAEVLELTAVAQLFGCHKATIDSSGTRPATD